MSDSSRDDSSVQAASVVLGTDGHFEDASAAALALLGRTLDELRSMSPRVVMVMTDAESQALSEAWRQPGSKTLAGEASVLRPDGSRLRVKFLLTKARAGRYRVIFETLAAPAESSFVIYTLPEVLAAWRAAERRLSEATVGSARWTALAAEVERFREHYRALVAEKTRALAEPTSRRPSALNLESEQPWP